MKACVVALVLCVSALPAPALCQTFNQFEGFGDSTVDSGWYRNLVFPTGNAAIDAALPAAIPNGGGISTTGPGPVSSQLLAGYFGLNAAPADQGGSNYATGGARNNQAGSLPNAVPTVTQIQNYLAANGGAANGNALYLIGSGGNDVTLYVNQVNASAITLSQGIQNVTQSANDLVTAISQLHAAGARYILVPNQPQSFGTMTEQSLRTSYDNSLWWGLASRGVNFIPVDYNAVIRAVAFNPSSFGFIAGAGPACVPQAGLTSGYAILCTPLTLVAPNAAQTHFFADDIHLSTAGQKVLADYEYSLMVGPSMVSMLAEAPRQTRANLVNVIHNQIPISQGQRGSTGFNTWLSGDVSSLQIKNYAGFPDDPGTPVALAAGFDYKLSNDWLVGIVLAVGHQYANFSMGFGGFTQDEFSVSAYSAKTVGPVWFDAIATYGAIDYGVKRNVPVGITVQNNAATASGSNLSLAGDVGYDFHFEGITFGPVAGVTLQQVHVSGFTESGSFTSLGFGAQTRNSAVSDLGYRVTLDCGRLSPFAKATWNHEFASTNRQVTAILTTSVAPSYAMPAVQTGSDWGALTAGTTVKLAGNVSGLFAVTSTVVQQNVTTYSGQVGINVSF
jgi:outer membrane lipase/esterase